jgi:hypothetical protein
VGGLQESAPRPRSGLSLEPIGPHEALNHVDHDVVERAIAQGDGYERAAGEVPQRPVGASHPRRGSEGRHRKSGRAGRDAEAARRLREAHCGGRIVSAARVSAHPANDRAGV